MVIYPWKKELKRKSWWEKYIDQIIIGKRLFHDHGTAASFCTGSLPFLYTRQWTKIQACFVFRGEFK